MDGLGGAVEGLDMGGLDGGCNVGVWGGCGLVGGCGGWDWVVGGGSLLVGKGWRVCCYV